MNLTEDQIRRRAEQIWHSDKGPGILGLTSLEPWQGPDSVQACETEIPVRFCRSTLEIAEKFAESEGPIVILTPVPEKEIPVDILARMHKQQLLRIDRTEVICDAYGVNKLDPRIPRSDAVMNALLRSAPTGVSERMQNLLTLDSAWHAVLKTHLGLSEALSPESMAMWSTRPHASELYGQVPEDLAPELNRYMIETLGSAGPAMMAALMHGHVDLILPIGVVCELFEVSLDGDERTVQIQAAARLEPYLGNQELLPEQASIWRAASQAVLPKLDTESQRVVLERAESLVQTLRIDTLVHHSTVLETGFVARKRRFGTQLGAYLNDQAGQSTLEAAYRSVQQHRLAGHEKYRPACNRLLMALRLVRFMEAKPGGAAESLAGACKQHAAHFAFVDWARRLLSGGDDEALLSDAVAQLCERIFEIRETFNRQFADLLADGLESESFSGPIRLIEHFLECVSETAANGPVLLLVLDGLDWSAFEELAEDLREHGWARWEHPEFHALLSAVPSVTDRSRKALLTEDLTPGTSAAEKTTFENNRALQRGATNALGARLFHKGELEDASSQGVSSSVRECIRETRRRVVGVVLNAVDDHLDKTDQLRLNWTIEQFRHLHTLLSEARQAGRTVIITSDHGHVLEDSSRSIASGSYGRWRDGGPEALEDVEIRLAGPRIEASTGKASIVALWSERARYGKKATGYHGGVAPQEVVVPYAAFTSGLSDLAGWHPAPEPRPNWWRGVSDALPDEKAPMPATQAKKSDNAQQSLFEAPSAPQDWVEALLSSTIYSDQRELAGRTAPDDSIVKKALRAMEVRNGRILARALAQEIAQPEIRMQGILAGLQRVLNLEGYAVIEVEDQSQTVKLDLDLLKQQFDLDA